MSGHGAPGAGPGWTASDVRVAVVAASWHEQVMGGLLDGALRVARPSAGIDGERLTVVRVPGIVRAAGRRGAARAGRVTTPSWRSAW